ncbi:hypothetical protein FJM67_00975 [Maribrevibacterium harenarium]|uniref:Uncharacterized protein n=1 Tax=Maribrevibacterium harenarium TaxID=2589817 RepID=A0A501X560_9GAMM|nr:HEPN domain-containing protein [Maribrevibacterium harenarium]TPE55655.1 hypothetical protein FJM67_00975 [Maribrevibacterium harenarium]
MTYTFAALKDQHRLVRAQQQESLSLRIHRSLSWLGKAEDSNDEDSRFIFLWIAFNAAYAQKHQERTFFTERDRYGAFISKLVDLDKDDLLADLVWSEFSNTIRIILNNEFIFPDFWRYQSGEISNQEWQLARHNATAAAHAALGQSDTATVLAITLSRLYILRNQIMHGGATYNSQTNRKQLKDCTQLLGKLVPRIIAIMMNSNHTLWGEAAYPVVKD